eukprot:3940410-Rhodomonas_salina.1
MGRMGRMRLRLYELLRLAPYRSSVPGIPEQVRSSLRRATKYGSSVPQTSVGQYRTFPRQIPVAPYAQCQYRKARRRVA